MQQKIYENNVFSFAMANKISSKEAEEKFLEFLNKEKPNTEEEYKLINAEYLVIKDYTDAIIKSNKPKGFIPRWLEILASASFYTLFFLNHYKILDVPYYFAPILLLLVLTLINYILFKNENKNHKEKTATLVKNKINEIKAELPVLNPQTFSDYIKEQYKKDKNNKIYKTFIKESINARYKSKPLLRAIFTFEKIFRSVIFILFILLSAFWRLFGFNYLIDLSFIILIHLSAMTFILNLVIDYLSFNEWNKVKTIMS